MAVRGMYGDDRSPTTMKRGGGGYPSPNSQYGQRQYHQPQKPDTVYYRRETPSRVPEPMPKKVPVKFDDQRDLKNDRSMTPAEVAVKPVRGPNGELIFVQPPPAQDPEAQRIRCVKFSIFGPNLLFWIIGVALLALGAWLKADDRFRDLLSENFRQVTSKEIDPTLYVGAYVIIGIALAMVVVSFFGCCGAIREHQCMLSTYFVCVMTLFFVEIAIVLLVFYKRDKMENDVGEMLDYMVQHYYQGPTLIQEVMDMLQVTFRCCGNSGCADYAATFHQNVPRSCDIACDGCRYRMFRAFRDGFTAVGIALLFVLIGQIVAVAASIYLCCYTRTHPKRHYLYARKTVSNPKNRGQPTPVKKTPI